MSDEWEDDNAARAPEKPSSSRNQPSPTPRRSVNRVTPSKPIASGSRISRTAPRRRPAIPLTVVQPLGKAPSTPPRISIPIKTVTPRPSTTKPSEPTKAPQTASTLITVIRILGALISAGTKIFSTLISPFTLYIYLTLIAALLTSGLIYYLRNHLPNHLLSLLSHLFFIPSPGSYLQTLEYPIRTLATPLCALTGLACEASLLSQNTTTSGGFWQWGKKTIEVDVGGVARSLTKEVLGAKDIFESVAKLSEGGMTDRLEYVRLWELGVAVSVGSNIESKDIIGREIKELGDTTRDLTDKLVETNVIAVNAFSWLQWEFESLVKSLSLPPKSRPSPEILARRLNTLLSKLSDNLSTLQTQASQAHTLATKGSISGQHLSHELHTLKSDLKKLTDLQPGWKSAQDKAKHFLLGGEPSATELVGRDLRLAELTIEGLSDLVHGLEGTRAGIKAFRDQIGWFDASMMGYHVGAGLGGIEAEEEVGVLKGVVEEFGRAIGRAKGREEDDGVRRLGS